MSDRELSRPPTVGERVLDVAFQGLCRVHAWFVILIAVGIVVRIGWSALPAMRQYGLEFLTSSVWDPNQGQYGIFPELVGTLFSSLLAIAFASILGLSVAIFLSEKFVSQCLNELLRWGKLDKVRGVAWLPTWLEGALTKTVELLAAIPSVVYGLWGIFVVIPTIRPFCDFLNQQLGWIPFFGTSLTGPGILPASLVLSIMILPTISAVVQDSLHSVPQKLRDASYAMGATRWETMLHVILPTARTGIIGAILLALGRAIGETMALAMLMGNSNKLSWSLFSPGNTLAALLANNFPEASKTQVPVLMYAALVLLLLTLSMNLLGVWVLQGGRVRREVA